MKVETNQFDNGLLISETYRYGLNFIQNEGKKAELRCRPNFAEQKSRLKGTGSDSGSSFITGMFFYKASTKKFNFYDPNPNLKLFLLS